MPFLLSFKKIYNKVKEKNDKYKQVKEKLDQQRL